MLFLIRPEAKTPKGTNPRMLIIISLKKERFKRKSFHGKEKGFRNQETGVRIQDTGGRSREKLLRVASYPLQVNKLLAVSGHPLPVQEEEICSDSLVWGRGTGNSEQVTWISPRAR